MSKPETKVVLGRRFSNAGHEHWLCHTKHGLLTLWLSGSEWKVRLEVTRGFTKYEVAFSQGPTEADAILALQSQLRKMAELEVAE
jgi:hypothetical protein